MVIQRWQTLLLLIAAVTMGLFSFCTLGRIQGADIMVNYSALGMTVESTGAVYKPTVYLFIVSLLGALLSLIAVFGFKRPKSQRKVVRYTVIVVLGAIVSAWLSAYFTEVPGADGISWSYVAACPIIALVVLLAAIRCISSDIRLLSGIDRLR